MNESYFSTTFINEFSEAKYSSIGIQQWQGWYYNIMLYDISQKSYVGDTHDGKEKIQNAEISRLENKIQQLEKDKTDAILSKDRALNR